jgi:hypothetical protein
MSRYWRFLAARSLSGLHRHRMSPLDPLLLVANDRYQSVKLGAAIARRNTTAGVVE